MKLPFIEKHKNDNKSIATLSVLGGINTRVWKLTFKVYQLTILLYSVYFIGALIHSSGFLSNDHKRLHLTLVTIRRLDIT